MWPGADGAAGLVDPKPIPLAASEKEIAESGFIVGAPTDLFTFSDRLLRNSEAH
jgi:hypothetical protein